MLEIFEKENDFQKFVPGFNNRYLINRSSTIFDTKRNREIKPHFSGVPRRNYLQVSLMKPNSERKTLRVHSLMAITFFGHEYGNRKIVVDHKDNNPLNNNLENLQIISMKENNTKDK